MLSKQTYVLASALSRQLIFASSSSAFLECPVCPCFHAFGHAWPCLVFHLLPQTLLFFLVSRLTVTLSLASLSLNSFLSSSSSYTSGSPPFLTFIIGCHLFLSEVFSPALCNCVSHSFRARPVHPVVIFPIPVVYPGGWTWLWLSCHRRGGSDGCNIKTLCPCVFKPFCPTTQVWLKCRLQVPTRCVFLKELPDYTEAHVCHL